MEIVRDDLGRYQSIDTKQYVINRKYNAYLHKAKYRNLDFNLPKEIFYKLLTSKCEYCGTEPFAYVKYKTHTMAVNGIDRIDSSKGYSISNVVSCCKICNMAKSNMTLEEFNNWLDKILQYRKTKNGN